MKNLFPLLLVIVLGVARADPPTTSIQGQLRISVSMLTWSAASGNWTNKTRHMFLGNNVYVDTSATGMAGEWKRIDNTVDSCSNPYLLTSQSDGRVRPVTPTASIGGNTYSRDKDSSIHVYRQQVRERFWSNLTNSWAPTAWSQKGSILGHADETITDSILIPNVGIVQVKAWNLGKGEIVGAEARACPDDVAATANEATDSIIVDTAWATSP